jgi:PilZ domain/PAS domain
LIYALGRDVTGLKHTEQALHLSKERYRLLFESNRHPVWVYDLESLAILDVNNVAMRSYGYSIRVAPGPIQREARRYERVKVACKVTIERNQERVSGMTLDLNLGGMFVQASRTLPLGSMVQILLELKPGAHPLAFPARIIRIAVNDCMGLQEFLLPKILTKRDNLAFLSGFSNFLESFE